MSSLFRAEAIAHHGNRLHGEVVLSQPLSTRVFAGALFAIVGIAAVWVSVGTYARIETVPGMLVTSVPSAKVVALQPGVVSELPVQEGQLVRKGDRLLVINSDREAAGGGDVAGRGLGALAVRQQLAEAQVGMASGVASAERSRLATLISSAEQQAIELRDQIDLQAQLVASNMKMFDQVTAVVERGFVSKVEHERRRQTLLASQQTLASLKQRLTATLGAALHSDRRITRPTRRSGSHRGFHRMDTIIAILKEQEAGMATAEVCRRHGVSSATFYKWKSKFGGLDGIHPAGAALRG